MKLYLFVALLVSVALVRAQDLDDLDSDISEEFDEFNGLTIESGEPLDLELPDEDEEYDEDDHDEDDEDDDDEDDEDDDKILPTTAYPTKRRWPGYKCMLKVKTCLTNATDCEEHLACYEEKATCMQAAKKDQKPFMKKPSKMVCKTIFNKCMERAGSDCFKKYMCHRKKGFCYRSRGRVGHRKPCGHYFRPHHRRRPHHHGRHPTMNPEMMKCKIQWRQCFMKANSCSERLQCMFDFHHCMNRSRPTSPPPTMSPDEDEEDMNMYRRRWNPKLMAKCKGEFKECIANSSSCPLKMRCFWLMKMCFKPHHRPHYGYKKKMMLIKITGRKPFNKFGGQWGIREMGGRYGQTTGRRWGKHGREMGRRIGETGRQWGNRGIGGRYGQTTGRRWGKHGREMGRRIGETGRQWGNRGIGGRYGQTTGRRWGKHGREMGRRIGETGRQWGNRGYKRVEKVVKPINRKFKNMWERHLG